MTSTEFPVLDWSVLWARLRKEAAVKKSLESLLAHHGETPEELRRLAENGDAEGVRMVAHKLRSVAGLLGALPTRDAAVVLEDHVHAYRTLDPDLVQSLIGKLEQLLVQARLGYADTEATRPKSSH